MSTPYGPGGRRRRLSTEVVEVREHRLELERLSDDGWRLCDTSAPPDDAAHVLAYIEQLDAGVDVVWLYGAFGRDRFDAIDEALVVATALLAEADARSARRPVPIPHFAPFPAKEIA